MCGIIGALDCRGNDVCGDLLNALRIMEYRGYDSAGITTISDGKFQSHRSVGRVSMLCSMQSSCPISGNIGIGHTRWATHGAPSLKNTHPLVSGPIAVVHNGIIENHTSIRTILEDGGAIFESDTDTETISQLIWHYILNGATLEQSVQRVANELSGLFACAVLSLTEPHKLIGIRKGLSLLFGCGGGACYLTSDVLSMSEKVEEFAEVGDGQIIVIEQKVGNADFHSLDLGGHVVQTKLSVINAKAYTTDKGHYKHFMLKEIEEQPQIVHNILKVYGDDSTNLAKMLSSIDYAKFTSFSMVACGTSFYAASVAKYIIESETDVRVDVEISSEFYLNNPIIRDRTLYVFLSQSGETADTLASLKYCRDNSESVETIAITNVENSHIARGVHHNLHMLCGPEVAVASTKSFVGQITILMMLCSKIMEHHRRDLNMWRNGRDFIDSFEKAIVKVDLSQVIQKLKVVVEEVGAILAGVQKVLYIGKNVCCPLAKEGALKMKELAYIPSEGIAAGELKHGPIALIDKDTPVIILAPQQREISAKIISSAQEVNARGGKIILIGSHTNIEQLRHICYRVVEMPDIVDDNRAAIPVVYAVPIQLLAYYTALNKGNDVDKPRNLAKSVTVE